MTSETRTLIEAADITGVEIECPECHLTILYPVDVEKVIKIGPSCPHCNHVFFDNVATNVYPGTHFPGIDSIQEIAAHLRKLRRDDRTDIHALVRFRIETEPNQE
ncbi:MAG TPA: hypothetical protein VI386_24920 [Candidatus Sulfotelmatobacter sp.]